MYTTLTTQRLPNIKGLNAGVVCNRYPVIPNVGASDTKPEITMYANGIIRWIEPDYIDKTYQEFNDMMGNNKVEAVYELATPITVTLTPNEVRTLLGQNNIWADTGDCAVEYRADTKLYIERLTAPDSADMVADANITSGKYFMVGNTLYKATANIANGSAIIVGTNCIRKSLSEALNEINA